ncbi:TlpA family protein disulfide reductase [Planctomicrobium sp. SH668]|uniref:TlpA family protein disulfide reductase n=1 Tax=Planctomicrobium sp. SH668 TaxID=3448126 RepID=UPI003F5C6ACE
MVRLIACLALLVFAGCKPASEGKSLPDRPSSGTFTTESAVPESASASNPVDGIQVKIANWEETLALVEQNKGKVVVVDVWATYCPPCIAEFPNLIRLHREFGDRIACISVSLDYEGIADEPVESYLPKVEKFLVKNEADIHNILLSDSSDVFFKEKVDQQSIPIVLVFDQHGQLAGQFPDVENPEEFTYQDQIIPLVEKLMK